MHVKHQAYHDALTGLPNARMLDELATTTLANAAREGRRIGMLFIDLDRFKDVNDSLGHQAGDQLLISVSDRLRIALRGGDTVARLGGDEFAVMLPFVPGQLIAEKVAERILTSLEQPFSIAGRQVNISASIGVAMSRPGDQFDDVLQFADLAMYEAKESGRAAIRSFSH
jgi:diguanylate cyclase (GGDEF)-like protein